MTSLRRLFKHLYKRCACGKCNYLIPVLKNNGQFAKYKHGHAPNGENHYEWKGGRVKYGDYWFLYMPNYYHAWKKGYVAEHIYVFQEYNKCCLLSWGVVHHIDPVTPDYCNNMPWNLQGMMKSQHSKMHNIKDMVDRFCSMSDCKYRSKYNRHWHKDGKGRYLCHNCYYKVKYYNEKNKLKLNQQRP